MGFDVDRLKKLIVHRNECLGKLRRLNKIFIETKGHIDESTMNSFMKRRELLFEAFSNINITIEKCRLENEFDKNILSSANREQERLINDIIAQDDQATTNMKKHMKEVGANIQRVKDIKRYESNSAI